MTDDFRRVAADLAAATGCGEVIEDEFYPTLRVEAGDLLAVAQCAKDKFGFDHLSNLTSVDFQGEYEVIYHLFSFSDPRKLCLRVRIPAQPGKIPSVFAVWPTADWQEREVYDLMGIVFTDHPNLVRILMPDDYKEHPLRKDFSRKGVRR